MSHARVRLHNTTPIYIRKRALYIHKKALWIRKRALYIYLRIHVYTWGRTATSDRDYVSAKEPYKSAKKPNMSAKEPYKYVHIQMCIYEVAHNVQIVTIVCKRALQICKQAQHIRKRAVYIYSRMHVYIWLRAQRANHDYDRDRNRAL